MDKVFPDVVPCCNYPVCDYFGQEEELDVHDGVCQRCYDRFGHINKGILIIINENAVCPLCRKLAPAFTFIYPKSKPDSIEWICCDCARELYKQA
jgi:hypothetical protein